MEEVLKDRYIVVFKEGRGNRRGDADKIRQRGGKLRHQFRRLRGAAVQLTPAQHQALAADPEVAYIEHDQLVFHDDLPLTAPIAAPNDPRYAEQWALENNGQTGGTIRADIDAPGAWNLTTGSPDVIVAVIDSGIDYNHPDLSANIWPNPGEIPGNGVDDDANGFIDDVHGWDFLNDDADPMDGYSHGVLISARADDSRERSRALEQICNTYWHPIYAYTRKRGFACQDAEDITQGFFAHLLETDEFTRMREEKGKLRTFLLVAVRNFMANEWRKRAALKRGGAAQLLSIDVAAAEDQTCLEPTDNLTPEIVFERHWASTMLHTVMGRLQRGFEDDGRADVFHTLKEFLIRGAGKQSYRDAAGKLGLSESAARITAHRMRKRYRELLLEEIAGTLSPDDSVEEELRYLFGVFES